MKLATEKWLGNTSGNNLSKIEETEKSFIDDQENQRIEEQELKEQQAKRQKT
tara:strand:+ start:1085 stop:1240 length:156 start_codon:yes stop_codon:yes gene_type:complete